MAGVWKRDGTIAVTKGSKKVVGTGTTFVDPKNAAAKGHLLVMVTGTAVDLYEVDYSESNSVFYLVEAYRGDTGTGKAYAIDTSRTDSIPEFARRLNATMGAYQQQSDAFQALLTSDAATIEVTAPDGTKHTMIPWKRVTSEGEGQVARAKAEADKAAASAAQAGSIVEASALPLPDVWAPLSDSLRMITGYGREVKVGDDVVARMVNLSRSTTATYIGKDGSLKTAAANEPRFEKEGLLIEGQSTNLVPCSQQFNWQDGNGPSPGVQSPNTDQQTSALIPTVDVSPGRRRPFIGGILTVGKTYTISFRAKSNGGVISQLSSQLTGAVYPAVAPGEWKTYSFTGVAIGSAVDFQITGTSVSIAWIQVEELPFASSYIPTNGAAVTRAGDVCSLPASGNWPNGDFVIAANLSYTKGWAENPILFVSGKDTPTPGFINTFLRDTNAPPDNRLAWYGATTSFLATSGALSTAVFRNRSGMRDIVYDGEILSMGAGGQNTGVPAVRIYLGSYGPFQFLNGHLRNLRIWHRALTDEQIKAVA